MNRRGTNNGRGRTQRRNNAGGRGRRAAAPAVAEADPDDDVPDRQQQQQRQNLDSTTTVTAATGADRRYPVRSTRSVTGPVVDATAPPQQQQQQQQQQLPNRDSSTTTSTTATSNRRYAMRSRSTTSATAAPPSEAAATAEAGRADGSESDRDGPSEVDSESGGDTVQSPSPSPPATPESHRSMSSQEKEEEERQQEEEVESDDEEQQQEESDEEEQQQEESDEEGGHGEKSDDEVEEESEKEDPPVLTERQKECLAFIDQIEYYWEEGHGQILELWENGGRIKDAEDEQYFRMHTWHVLTSRFCHLLTYYLPEIAGLDDAKQSKVTEFFKYDENRLRYYVCKLVKEPGYEHVRASSKRDWFMEPNFNDRREVVLAVIFLLALHREATYVTADYRSGRYKSSIFREYIVDEQQVIELVDPQDSPYTIKRDKKLLRELWDTFDDDGKYKGKDDIPLPVLWIDGVIHQEFASLDDQDGGEAASEYESTFDDDDGHEDEASTSASEGHQSAGTKDDEDGEDDKDDEYASDGQELGDVDKKSAGSTSAGGNEDDDKESTAEDDEDENEDEVLSSVAIATSSDDENAASLTTPTPTSASSSTQPDPEAVASQRQFDIFWGDFMEGQRTMAKKMGNFNREISRELAEKCWFEYFMHVTLTRLSHLLIFYPCEFARSLKALEYARDMCFGCEGTKKYLKDIASENDTKVNSLRLDDSLRVGELPAFFHDGKLLHDKDAVRVAVEYISVLHNDKTYFTDDYASHHSLFHSQEDITRIRERIERMNRNLPPLASTDRKDKWLSELWSCYGNDGAKQFSDGEAPLPRPSFFTVNSRPVQTTGETIVSNSDLQDQLGKSQEAIKKLQLDVNDLQDQLDKSQEANKKLQMDVNQLQSHFETLRRQFDELEQSPTGASDLTAEEEGVDVVQPHLNDVAAVGDISAANDISSSSSSSPEEEDEGEQSNSAQEDEDGNSVGSGTRSDYIDEDEGSFPTVDNDDFASDEDEGDGRADDEKGEEDETEEDETEEAENEAEAENEHQDHHGVSLRQAEIRSRLRRKVSLQPLVKPPEGENFFVERLEATSFDLKASDKWEDELVVAIDRLTEDKDIVFGDIFTYTEDGDLAIRAVVENPENTEDYNMIKKNWITFKSKDGVGKTKFYLNGLLKALNRLRDDLNLPDHTILPPAIARDQLDQRITKEALQEIAANKTTIPPNHHREFIRKGLNAIKHWWGNDGKPEGQAIKKDFLVRHYNDRKARLVAILDARQDDWAKLRETARDDSIYGWMKSLKCDFI